MPCHDWLLFLLLRIHDTAETQRSGTIVARRHQQKFAVFVVAVGLRKIPDGALRAVVAAPSQNSRPRMIIRIFVCPLPDVSHHIHHPKRACSCGMSIHLVGAMQNTSFVRNRNDTCIPAISPRIGPAIASLRGILPLPLVRKPFSSPSGIGPGIFERNPGNWLIGPSLRIGSIFPVAEEVQIILRMIVSGIQERLEFRIRDRVFVDIERANLDRKSTRLNSSHGGISRMPSSA